MTSAAELEIRHRRRRIAMWEMWQSGKTQAEVARAFGISASVVGVHLAKTRRELNRIKYFRKALGRIDATQPDDPPRGVWIDK